MQYKNLTLIGSSHVSIESVRLVKKTIEEEKPGIIAVELDKDRLEALLHKKKQGLFIRGVGFKGMLFAAICGWIEKRIGRIVKVEPGSEMKMAVRLAKEHKAKLALIDQHITITLRRFSQSLTWKEKWRFVVDIFLGLVTPNRQAKKLGMSEADLTKVPDQKTIQKLLKYVSHRYPNVYKVLVKERNVYMANNLAVLMKAYPQEKIVAVVGAGHEEEMIALVKEKLYKHSSA